MRIHPLSDLHNEFAPFTAEVRDADIVILAGDIDLGVRGIEWARQAFDCPVLSHSGIPVGLTTRFEGDDALSAPHRGYCRACVTL